MKILIALDDSPVSIRAAREAVRLFSPVADASFLVVSVATLPVPWVGGVGYGAAGPLLIDPRWTDPAHSTAEDERALLDDAHAAGVPDPTPLVREGDPVAQICTVADEHDVDVIVIGSHDKTGLRRFFDPSTADAVVHGTTRPVLVISGEPTTKR